MINITKLIQEASDIQDKLDRLEEAKEIIEKIEKVMISEIYKDHMSLDPYAHGHFYLRDNDRDLYRQLLNVLKRE